jgi:hypothetical protein
VTIHTYFDGFGKPHAVLSALPDEAIFEEGPVIDESLFP